ncbi:MAG: DUF4124 domain-containing protein [Nitrospira sp.]
MDRQLRIASVLLGLIMGMVWCLATVPALATTIYSYIDDQGNPRFSDSIETVPDKYRAKVKTHEQPTPEPKQPTALESVRSVVSPSNLATLKQKLNELLQSFGFSLPGSAPSAAPASRPSAATADAHEKILTYAGIAAVVLLGMMYLSKSQLVRLLGLCLLIALGIGTPVLLYIGDNGAFSVMKEKATAAGQAQVDRVNQVAR